MNNQPSHFFGHLFVLSGPSGVGKTVVAKALLTRDKKLQQGVTYTTRRPRRGSVEDKVMRYVTMEKFRQLIRQRAFLEWARVHDHYYGTARQEVMQRLAHGNVLLNIDVQGGLQVVKRFPDAVLILLKPSSLGELKQRLGRRPDMTDKELRVRLTNVRRELALGRRYAYHIVNPDGQLPATIQAVAAIIDEESKNP